MRILVTGGAGYIGSHTCIEFLQCGHDVVIADNLINSRRIALDRVQEITGKNLEFHRVDLLDRQSLDAVFDAAPIDAVVHFAGLKAVGESVEKPLLYYSNNIVGTINLTATMLEREVRLLVFSSSATVYGAPPSVPIREDFPLRATNPYGRTKLIIEEMLRDLYVTDRKWNIALLRYFNPVGAHPSGHLGEAPDGTPNNLMPYIAQVASGQRSEVSVFGDDYPTADGTGIRDYIHVVDLARGHLAALNRLRMAPGLVTYNLGTGQGYSVMDVIEAFARASGREIPYRIVARRPGDIAVSYADTSLARAELHWYAELALADMCADSWRWHSQNPSGFA